MINLIILIIFIINVNNISLLTWIFLLSVIEKFSNPFQYKLNNPFLEGFGVVMYVSIFFILAYIWRIYNLKNALNLKTLFDNIHRLYLINFSHFDLSTQFILAILLFFIILNIFLCLLKLNLLFYKTLIKFYLRFEYNDLSCKRSLFLQYLEKPGNQDIITYFILEIAYKLTIKFDNVRYENQTLPPYHLYRILSNLISCNFTFIQKTITVSPLLFFVYDIIWNEYLLNHFYYYMIIYIPLIILRRISKFLNQDSSNLIVRLWRIYYKKEKNVLYAISPTLKPIFDTFILSGLSNQGNLDLIDIHFIMSLALCFNIHEPTRNVYINNDGICLVLTKDNKVFVEEEDIEDFSTDEFKIVYKLGEEWHLIALKI